jgi:hypothetical protein
MSVTENSANHSVDEVALPKSVSFLAPPVGATACADHAPVDVNALPDPSMKEIEGVVAPQAVLSRKTTTAPLKPLPTRYKAGIGSNGIRIGLDDDSHTGYKPGIGSTGRWYIGFPE